MNTMRLTYFNCSLHSLTFLLVQKGYSRIWDPLVQKGGSFGDTRQRGREKCLLFFRRTVVGQELAQAFQSCKSLEEDGPFAALERVRGDEHVKVLDRAHVREKQEEPLVLPPLLDVAR